MTPDLNRDQVIDREPSADVIDLSGIAVLTSKYGPVIRLADLVRVGYKIKPDSLVRNLKVQLTRDSEIEDLLQEALGKPGRRDV